MSDDDIAIAAILLAIALKRKRKRKDLETNKRVWSKEWAKNRRNPWEGKVLKELEYTADNDFHNCVRMRKATFDDLLSKIAHRITKKNTVMRESIPPHYRLSLTLRFLVSGMCFEELKYLTAISPQTIGKLVIETCNAIITELKNYIKLPQTEEDWIKEADAFHDLWNFPNCIGSIDGRHIKLIKPSGSGTLFLNYMTSFSVILMAMVNANYEFMMVDINMNGKASNAEAQFLSELEEKILDKPTPSIIPDTKQRLPYVFVADNAFALSENIMTPFSQNTYNLKEMIFNHRLARARRTVENTFGILASRFKVLLQTMNLSPDKVKIVTLTCCYLHNFLVRKKEGTYLDGGFEFEDSATGEISPTDWDNGDQLDALEPTTSDCESESAKSVRSQFCNYFSSSGQVLRNLK